MNEHDLIIIPEDIREDVKIAGFLNLWKIFPIVGSLFFGIVLFIILPGHLGYRGFIMFAVPAAISYIVIFDVRKNKRLDKELKKVKREGHRIEIVKIDSPFLYFQDGSVGIAVKIEPLPKELTTGNQQYIAGISFMEMIRWGNMHNAIIELYVDPKYDTDEKVLKEKEQQYEEVLQNRSKIKNIMLMRNRYHFNLARAGGRTAYHMRVRIKGSEEELIGIVEEMIESIRRTGDQAYIVGEDALYRLNEYQLKPTTTSRPVYFESDRLMDKIKDLMYWGRMRIKKLMENRKKQKAEQKKNNIFKHGSGRKIGGEEIE
ncbi:hypothetical protein [Thermotalea metallivorans]|uniref:Uncharacterized protein n=1 Tax=Thermotalea metallivorans TaxID=520762 RepID=A0A140L9Z2_9FIRM|nr:hypothetical protein [Thermotalea metallivorans]KXG77367.1 hypothetical protein AN619_04930 [Thermotalea metallivorans]